MSAYTITHDELVEKCTAIDEGKFDIVAQDSVLNFPGGREVIIMDEGVPRIFNLTYYSFRQLFQKFAKISTISETESYELSGRRTRGTSPATFLWNNPKHIAPVMNDLLYENSKNSNFLFRCKNDTLRAFLSERYAPISNTRLAVQTIAGIEKYDHLANLKIDNNFIKLDIIVENREVKNDSDYGVGFQLRNDEIGLSSLEISGTIKRTTCDNSIAVQTPIRMYHTGDIYERLGTGLVKLPIQLNLADQLFNRMETAKTEKFSAADFQMMVENAKKRDNLSDEFLEAFFKGAEKQETLFGFVNGLTYAAHKVHGDNPLRQKYFEDIAADMLVTPNIIREKRFITNSGRLVAREFSTI